jgi:benzoyl-CoA reductase/2-hydroxyglutaryl-CoA dehydratase subunit BcrC/BadD/HgdB
MNRKESMEKHRSQGGKVLAVFPGRYPRAACEAAGFLPVEVWDPPGDLSDAGAHLPAFVCSVAQRGLGYFLDGKLQVDALLFPHICDTLQNMFSIVRDCVAAEKSTLMFYPPRGDSSPAMEQYLAGKVEALSEQLAQVAGCDKPDGDALRTALDEQVKAQQALGHLYLRRKAGALGSSNREFYDMVRLAEYLPALDFAAAANDFLQNQTGAAFRPDAPKIVLSGVLPQRELIDALDNAGCLVVEDDLLSAGRRVLRKLPELPEDPWLAMARLLLALPPCTTVGASLDARGEFLESLASSGAQGVVFHTVKFCEPELFDHPVLLKRLAKIGMPTLVLESELYPSSDGPMVTRLEAFLEMVS